MIQMSIIILFVSAGILFHGDFSLWVPLNHELPTSKLHAYGFSVDWGGKTKQKKNRDMNQERQF